MSFAIVRVAKRKDIASVRRCATHHLRAAPTPNADPARQIHILAGSSDHLDVAHQVDEKTEPLMKRKDAIRALDVFCGTSPDFFKNGGSVEDFKSHAMKWAEDTFGKSNIVLAVLHDDETTPHIQMIVTPITPQGKLSASHWVDGPKKLSALQDSFAAEMQPLGLVRGVKGSKAKHQNIQRWYATEAAREQELEAKQKALDQASAEIALKTHQNRTSALKIEEARAIIIENQKRLKSRSSKLDERETIVASQESTVTKLLSEVQRQKLALIALYDRLPLEWKSKIKDVFGMKKPEAVIAQNNGETAISPLTRGPRIAPK